MSNMEGQEEPEDRSPRFPPRPLGIQSPRRPAEGGPGAAGLQEERENTEAPPTGGQRVGL